MYSDSGSTVSIRIVSHAITVEAIRPLATPWSENTTIEIRITDVDNASIIIQSSNVTNIKIGSQVFTSWIWDNGCFTVVVDTDDWAIGFASYGVEITTNGTGTTKYFADRSSSVVIEIRNRYSEAYAPSPDPVPYLDNLTFYIEFGDRDSSGALVDLTKIYLNDSSLIENTDYWVVRVSEGYYQVTMVTTSLTIGNHQVVVTCEHTNYENATTTVRFRVRLTETEAVASGYRFDVPLGTNITFTIEYNDIDHNQGIAGATLVNNGTLESTNVYNGNGVYEVKIITWDNTALDTYTIRFNLTKTNFEDAHVIVIITVEMHSTYLSFDEPVVPTGIASNITVYLFYEDMSLNTGISNSTGNITVCLTNDINPSTTFTVQNNTGLGVGHYLILIPADQFGGLYNVNFTVYFNWTNVPKYANLTRTFSVQLQGTPTDLSVYIAPEAIYYNNWVNFTLLYKNSENNVGVGNSSGNVWVSAEVTTAGQSVSPSAFQITWIDNGHYRFLLNSSHFTSYGSFVIKTCFGWNQTASPYYENQTLSITVTILVRTTLLDVTPPQNTAFDENATFTFTYYDSPSNSAIANSTNMEVQLDNAGVEYWLSYNSGDCVWTVIVNTTSIGSIGPIDLILKVTWGGAPFYQNQTKTVVLQVTARPTQLTYSAPIPTFFNSNLTVVFTYIDLIDDSSSMMSGSSLTLTSDGLTLTGNYTVVDNGDGTYTVALNTTAFPRPGTYTVQASMQYSGSRYESDADVTFNLKVSYRGVIADDEPVGNTPWLQDIEVILHITDSETAALVSNTTGNVRIRIADQNETNADITGLSISWVSGTDTYTVSIANNLSIGTYALSLNVSYDDVSPYYGFRVVQLKISIRKHSTEIQLYDPPARTGFNLNTTFRLYYVDLDTELPIIGATIRVDNVTLDGNWTIVSVSDGYYEVRINTTAFLDIGTYCVEISTQNTGTMANYADTSIYVKIYVRERYTLLSYDPVPTVGYTDNVTITVYYTDSDNANAGITNSTYSIHLSTNQTTYYVSDGTEAGSFVIELPANQFVAFEYSAVEVTITYSGIPFYENQTINVRFKVTGTFTEFAWDPSDPVPFGDRANITFYWGDSDTGQPVDCALDVNVSITVESVTQPGLNTSDSNILLVVQGRDVDAYATFFLLLNTSYLDDWGIYKFRISINWVNASQAPYYQDQLDKAISLVVRVRDTAVPQVQADPVAYGENALIRLQYVDLDNDSVLVQGGALTITVLDGLIYSVNPTPVDGFYEIEVVTKGTDLLGAIRINITVEWAGKPFFENQTSVYASLTVNPRVASVEVEFPAATPYLDDVVFYIVLKDTHSLECINNNASFLSAVFKIPSIADTPVISYVAASDGKYKITFNSTVMNQVGTFILEITFDHSATSPYYALLKRNVTGTIRERTTTLEYTPVSSVPYGNYTLFNVTYTDADSSAGIDSAQIYVSCSTSSEQLAEGVNYWYAPVGNGIYTINVSTTALGAPSSYSIQIIANSTADWWLLERTRIMTIGVAYRNVELAVSSPDATYYNEITSFTITLTDIDNRTVGTGLEGMISYLSVVFTTPSGVSNATVQIVDLGNGLYEIIFNTSILEVLSDYVVEVTYEPPDGPNYWKPIAPRTVTGRVNARQTQLSFDVTSSTPYLDNITISLTLEDLVASSGVAGADFVLTSSAATLIESTNYWISESANGVYVVLVSSDAFGDTGTFHITIEETTSGVPFYQNRTVNVPVQVRERATRLAYTPPAETPFADNLTVTLRYYDVDAGLVGIESAASCFTLDSINGTPVDSTYYWMIELSGGVYQLIINTTKLDIIGHYNLTVTTTGLAASHYDNQTIWLEADIRARNTQLTTAPIAQTSYTENATVLLYFIDKDADVGVTNDTAGVTLSLVGVNATTNWWAEEVSAGEYQLKINASGLGSVGDFSFEATFSWVNGKPYYANRTVVFTISVTGSGATLSYTPPAHVPIGDNITITIEYRDLGTRDGISNSSGYVGITIAPLNSTTIGQFQYWVENPADGVFVYTINSTPFWTTGSLFFEFNITWAKQLPFYTNITGTVIRAIVRDVNTQAFADAPSPGTVPMGDNVSVVITFHDLDHNTIVLGSTIQSDWLYDWSHVVLSDGRFNVTLSTVGITTLGKLSIVFTFNKTFYLTKTSTVEITMRLASTVSYTTSPEPAIVPVGDNVTLEVTYYDLDHHLNITDGSVTSDWAFGWTWTRVTNGGFRVTLCTENVTNMITYTVSFTVSKDGFLDGVSSTKIRVRLIRTGISAQVPSDSIAGSNATVTITFYDLDHNTGIEGATLLPGTDSGTYELNELGSGKYEIKYILWQEPAGTYSYLVTANAEKHESASLTVDLDLRLALTELTTSVSIIIVDWSNSFYLETVYKNLDLAEYIENATVKATISGTEYNLTYDGVSNNYSATIDTSVLDVGTYIITITANKTNFEARIVQVTLVVSVLQTVFLYRKWRMHRPTCILPRDSIRTWRE
jgi:hypothetical protein